jgi:hypothetical protein
MERGVEPPSIIKARAVEPPFLECPFEDKTNFLGGFSFGQWLLRTSP